MIPCSYKAPEFLRQTAYKNPTDPAGGIFQYAKDYNAGDLFQYYKDHPREGASFNNVMGAVMANQATWFDIIPVRTFMEEYDPSRALVVDVGGNVGHDLEKFRQAYPNTAPLLYLQDRAAVLEQSKCPEPVKKMAHDFFQPQPIKGKPSKNAFRRHKMRPTCLLTQDSA